MFEFKDLAGLSKPLKRLIEVVAEYRWDFETFAHKKKC